MHAEITDRRQQRRRAHLWRVEWLACLFDESVKPSVKQQRLQAIVEHVARCAKHLIPCHEGVALKLTFTPTHFDIPILNRIKQRRLFQKAAIASVTLQPTKRWVNVGIDHDTAARRRDDLAAGSLLRVTLHSAKQRKMVPPEIEEFTPQDDAER